VHTSLVKMTSVLSAWPLPSRASSSTPTLGVYPIVTLEKQLLIMIGNLV
jgi:hypothetical protein